MFFPKVAYAAEGGMEEGVQVVFELYGLEVTSEITTMWGVMLFLTIISFLATRNLQRIPSGLQNIMEFVIESLINFLAGIMGEARAKKYLPLLASLFITILISNYSGILPGAGHTPGLKAPTSNWSVTLGLAIVVFLAVQFYGFQARGPGYLKHFFEPLPFMFPLNIIEQFTRVLSLSLRLFGNVYGEEMVVAGLFALVPLFVPIPMQALGLLFGFIQAFVFTLLAAIYISEATEVHH